MLNPSYLVRSIGKFISDIPEFATYDINTGLQNKEQVKNANIVHVSIGKAEAFSATNSQVGSSRWVYPVVVDIWISQNTIAQNYDDGPRGEITKALGDGLIGGKIGYCTYKATENATGTFVIPTAIKIDFEAGPAARFEITLE